MWRRVDKTYLGIVVVLLIIGFIAFASASLGMLPREAVSVPRLFMTQVILGVILGSLALITALFIPHRWYKRVALLMYLFTVLLTFLVFVPGLGISAGGATRWLDLGIISVQPAEFLKLGVVFLLATHLAMVKARIREFRYGLIPFLIILGVALVPLVLQPDTGTLLVLATTAVTMYFASGAPWRDMGILAVLGGIGVVLLAYVRPYIFERLTTFLNPANDPLGAGFQIQQSLIAIGSGGITGRGIGQGVQKFTYLPEPVGDSIFAVFAEETGFVGAFLLIALIVALFARGMHISARAPDHFAALLVLGISVSILAQSFLNIGAMLGLVPLTGLPLIFVSHGGTALLVALASVGIILRISANTKKTL